MAFVSENESETQIQKPDEVTCDITENITDWSDEKIADEMFYSTLETVKVTIIAPFIFVVGLLGNSAFFLLLARVKRMRTLTNFYLANLAVADILLLLVRAGYLTATYHQSVLVWSQPFLRSIGCILNAFVCGFTCMASLSLITFISFDRYFAICKPVKYRLMKNKKFFSFIAISLIWICSAMISCLFILTHGKLVFKCIVWPSEEKYSNIPNFGQYCDPIYPYVKDINCIFLTMSMFVILITNSVLYIKIVKKLKQPMGENGKNSNQKIKKHVTLMILANSVIFFCCVTPTQLLILLVQFLDHSDEQQVRLSNTAFIFIMVNSAVNPIIYGAASPSYRRGFLKAFGLANNQVEPTEDQETDKTKSTIAH